MVWIRVIYNFFLENSNIRHISPNSAIELYPSSEHCINQHEIRRNHMRVYLPSLQDNRLQNGRVLVTQIGVFLLFPVLSNTIKIGDCTTLLQNAPAVGKIFLHSLGYISSPSCIGIDKTFKFELKCVYSI